MVKLKMVFAMMIHEIDYHHHHHHHLMMGIAMKIIKVVSVMEVE
jgi:hypothetical protein